MGFKDDIKHAYYKGHDYKAYRKLSLKVHPDKCTILMTMNNKCDAAFKLINNAYDSLITQYNTI